MFGFLVFAYKKNISLVVKDELHPGAKIQQKIIQRKKLTLFLRLTTNYLTTYLFNTPLIENFSLYTYPLL